MTSENQKSDRRRFVSKILRVSALAGLAGLLLGRLREPTNDAATRLFPGVLAPVAAATTSYTDSGLNVTVISGYASNDSGTGRGVYGQSDADGGIGVEGLAFNASGSTSGVYGSSRSILGQGVVGYVDNASGATRGVYGFSHSLLGRGVYGFANNASGETYGVYGESASIAGQGVYGWASNASGLTVGVYGASGSIAGTGVYGYAGTGTGVEGNSTSSTGVKGSSSTGTGIWATSNGAQALLATPGAGGVRPIVVRAHPSQSVSLQEWQNALATPLTVVDANGRLGVGTASPARSIHLQTNNAVFRMDRDVNSSAFILTRTALGSFGTVWKTFYVGVDASGVDDGLFFVGDRHQFVSGDSDKRLIINNTGLVGIGRTPTTNNLEVEGTASKTVAGGFLANSDVRIKTDIEDIDDALATIEKLHPVRFRYTDSYRAKHPSIKDHAYYNFIAQEYRDVFPESVQDDADGLLQMDNHNTVPYLVRAVQELSERGEVVFENGYKVTKDDKTGLAFKNDEGEKIAVLDREGNFHIKGKIVEDL